MTMFVITAAVVIVVLAFFAYAMLAGTDGDMDTPPTD